MRKLAALIAVLSLLLGCNDGGTNKKTITALSLPKLIKVIDPADDQTAGVASLNTIKAVNFDSAGTDFSADTTQTFVDEPEMAQINNANLYLCIFDQLNYQKMVNKGAYTVPLDYTMCIQKVLHISIPSDPSYIYNVTVISERPSNSSPQTLKIWLPNPDNNQNLVLFDITIYDNANPTKPFGEFTVASETVTVDNKGRQISTGSGTYVSGVSSSGKPFTKGIDNQFDYTGSDVHEAYSVTLESGGKGSINSRKTVNSTTSTTTEHSFTQFNQNFILTGGYDDANDSLSSQVCRSRQQFFRERMGYTLYHANDGVFRGDNVTAGERVRQNFFFYFNYDGINGSLYEDHYVMDDGQVLPDGAVVTTPAMFNPYNRYHGTFTAHVTPANLTRTSQGAKPLSELSGKSFLFFGENPLFPQLTVDVHWIVTVDQNNNFRITHALTNIGAGAQISDTLDEDNDPATPEVPVAVTLTPADGDAFTVYEQNDFISTLNYFDYTHDASVAPQDRSISFTFLQEQTALSNDLFTANNAKITLYCYIDCPIGGVTQADLDNAVSLQSALYYNSGYFDATAHTYTLQSSNFRFSLIDDNNSRAVDASQLSSNNDAVSQYSPRLLTAPLAETATSLDLFSAPLSYRWESSANSFSQRVVFTNTNGQPLTFDHQAMRVLYTFDAGDDVNNKDPLSNPYQGNTFMLTYFQPGFLSGLPDSGGQYAINLETGTMMANDEGQYVAKPIYEFQQPMEVGLTQCNGLDLNGLVTDPQLDFMTDADIIDVSFGVDDKPGT